MYDHKKWHANFHIFLKISLAAILKIVVTWGSLSIFRNLNNTFFGEKKKFETNFIMSRALFWIVQPKRKKYIYIFFKVFQISQN